MKSFRNCFDSTHGASFRFSGWARRVEATGGNFTIHSARGVLEYAPVVGKSRRKSAFQINLIYWPARGFEHPSARGTTGGAACVSAFSWKPTPQNASRF